MEYNINMRNNKSMIRRVATLGLTAWFAALTIFVQGPHRHPANESGAHTDSGHAACVVRGHDQDARACIEQLGPCGPSLWESYGEFGYCLACLFLKNCKQPAVAQTPPIPVLSPIKSIPQRTDLRYASLVAVAASPRAPPVSII